MKLIIKNLHSDEVNEMSGGEVQLIHYLKKRFEFLQKYNMNLESIINRLNKSQNIHIILEDSLKKNTTPPKFPGLGVTDTEQVPKITSDRQREIAQRSIVNDFKTTKGKQLAISKLTQPAYGRALLTPQNNIKAYSLENEPAKNMVKNPTSVTKDPRLAESNAQHEKFHVLMRNVQKIHGAKASLNLAENLFNHIPKEYQETLKDYVKHRFPNYAKANPMYYEEHLSALFNYLNSREERVGFHKSKGHITDQEIASGNEGSNENYQKYDRHMKGAFRVLKHLASKADERWLKNRITPKGLAKTEFELNSDQLEVAEGMGGLPDTNSIEFKAAKLISGYKPTDADLKHAYNMWEDDFESYVLAAHKIEVTKENIEKLRTIVKTFKGDDIKKTENEDFMIMSIPREIRPFDINSEKFSIIAEEAFKNNNVKSVELNGKHSHGSAILYDSITDTLWFLKPGSGQLSSAKGVNETIANQSRREVAFNNVAKLVGLDKFVPESGLILLDRHEVAMLEFFSDYVSLNKLKKAGQPLGPVFEQMVPDGTVHRLAALDYLLGQTDRHAGNVLFKEGGIKLIDAGSAFAGESFDPGKDPKTYIPIYLRAFSTKRFSEMDPIERVKMMPRPTFEGDKSLEAWVNNISEEQISNLLKEYGINPNPILHRLTVLKEWNGSKSEFLNKFWAGVI